MKKFVIFYIVMEFVLGSLSFLCEVQLLRIVAIIFSIVGVIILFVLEKVDGKKLQFAFCLGFLIFQVVLITNYFLDYQFMDEWVIKYSLVLTLICAFTHKILLKKSDTIALAILMLLACMPILSVSNVELDTGNVEQINSKVIDKAYLQIYSFNTEYEFLLECNIGDEKYWVNVPYDVHKKMNLGDNVTISIGEGLLNKSYYYYNDNNNYYKDYIKERGIIIDENDSLHSYLKTQKVVK